MGIFGDVDRIILDKINVTRISNQYININFFHLGVDY